MENVKLISDNKCEFCKPTFNKISEEKRERIYIEAEKEFARNGYLGANINVIAKNANISIGSMYSYFESKENLFLAVLQRGIDLIVQATEVVKVEEYDFYQFIKEFLKVTREYAIKYPQINQIYIDLASFSSEKFAHRLSYSIESVTKDMYMILIKKAKNDGVIREDVKDEIVAYYIDNLIMTYQYSFASFYWKKRMDVLLDGKFSDYEEIEDELVGIIERGLR